MARLSRPGDEAPRTLIMNEQRILVVDDDDAIRALLYTILRRRGMKVDTAHNGVEALERATQCRYAVLLLDLMMPQKNGYEVLRDIARFPPDERPLVLVLTAGSEPRDLDPKIVAGTIRKPFNIDMLVETISGCLSTLPEVEQHTDCPEPEGDGMRSN